MADTRLITNFDDLLVVHKERNIEFIEVIKRILLNALTLRKKGIDDIIYFGDISDDDEEDDILLEYSYS